MCYINCTKDLAQSSYCGDTIHILKLALFGDADFAGDKSESNVPPRCLCALPDPLLS